ncbi:hypothetical protein Tco_1261566 [Tanacetum coccineum]
MITVVDVTSYQARDRRPRYPNSNHCQAWIQRGPTTAATTLIFVTTTARDANTVNNKRRDDRVSKENLPQLVQEIQEKIMKGTIK